ncbi:ester cyclase [Streptomyces sp. I05A-00742]|uniref:ester cyclase n=1 Tax=Streptomyces sp. I05A-00742 TaxID=2732853 RepID=UPI001488F12E|nr:ester cyclase [Streptomyces sp. I05A-00742]
MDTASHPGKQLVTDCLRAISERRLDDLPRYLARDVVDHNKMIFGEPDEPGAAFEGIRQQLAAFGELGIRVDGLVAEGGTVVARLTVSGKHTGEHPRMPRPTGRSFEVEQIWVFTVADGADGRITEIRAVSDRLGMFLQLGWDWPEAD